MKYFKGDLLEADVDVIAHVANIYHTFGSGIAYHIKNKYPEAYQADLASDRDCESKLGSFTKAMISENRMVYNLYAMIGIGNDGNPLNRNLSYDHFFNGLYKICIDTLPNYRLCPIIIGVPKYIGCARAGGNWNIVNSILDQIESEFEDRIEIHVYELEVPEHNPMSTLPTL